MKEKGKKTLLYSLVFIISLVIFTLLTILLENAMKVQKNMVNITFQGMPQLFLMKFVIHIVSAVCVIIICVIIKKLIDINKIACILPIAVTAVISVLPFIVSAMGDVTGFIVAIFIDLTTWTVY